MKRILTLIAAAAALVSCSTAPQDRPYYDKAEEMFSTVWNLYRVPEYGLFSEYYPSSAKPDLDYFDDGVHQAQEVSFLWPMSGIFSSTVLLAEAEPEKYRPYLDSMVVSMEMYYDTTRVPFAYQAYPTRLDRVDRYYDDNGLVGIDYIDTYRVTRNPAHLEKAKQIMSFILSGWDFRYEGGVPWVEGKDDQKPACSNGKAMVLALKLYDATSNDYYLQTGIRLYEWISKWLKDPELNIVWNAWITEGEGHVQKAPWTYNTGTLLQAAAALYRITGEQKYLDDAQALAKGSADFFFHYTDDGIPYTYNIPWFDVVLFRGYQALYDITGDPTYVDIFIKAVDWAWDHARDGAGLVCRDWTGLRDETRKPKWLLDSSCVIEFLTRIAIIRKEI